MIKLCGIFIIYVRDKIKRKNKVGQELKDEINLKSNIKIAGGIGITNDLYIIESS